MPCDQKAHTVEKKWEKRRAAEEAERQRKEEERRREEERSAGDDAPIPLPAEWPTKVPAKVDGT